MGFFADICYCVKKERQKAKRKRRHTKEALFCWCCLETPEFAKVFKASVFTIALILLGFTLTKMFTLHKRRTYEMARVAGGLHSISREVFERSRAYDALHKTVDDITLTNMKAANRKAAKGGNFGWKTSSRELRSIFPDSKPSLGGKESLALDTLSGMLPEHDPRRDITDRSLESLQRREQYEQYGSRFNLLSPTSDSNPDDKLSKSDKYDSENNFVLKIGPKKGKASKKSFDSESDSELKSGPKSGKALKGTYDSETDLVLKSVSKSGKASKGTNGLETSTGLRNSLKSGEALKEANDLLASGALKRGLKSGEALKEANDLLASGAIKRGLKSGEALKEANDLLASRALKRGLNSGKAGSRNGLGSSKEVVDETTPYGKYSSHTEQVCAPDNLEESAQTRTDGMPYETETMCDPNDYGFFYRWCPCSICPFYDRPQCNCANQYCGSRKLRRRRRVCRTSRPKKTKAYTKVQYVVQSLKSVVEKVCGS